ncbi:cytochrome C oxidase subunit IV family protein [Singulisphaera sp. PoT]|uniref:cytochrome C oxidase subunit IV family protein n=1 Tax=Singulisphaera sp. PoT TaxID=3411797 RepID=UPI003BF5ACC2
MAETNLTHDQEMEVESHAPYMKIFFILAIFTVAEYIYATYLPLSFLMLVIGLMAMAITKAALVGLYFMHLKFEGRWVYAFLIPAAILAVALVSGLLPDMAFQPVTEENPDLENIETTPVQPGAAASATWDRSILKGDARS